MKLCFLAGADSIHSKKWIQYFADRGHEIHWISLTPNYYGDMKNLKLYLMKKIPEKTLDLLINTITIKNLVRKINPDILHAHYVGTNGVIGAFSNFHPFVLTAWGSDILIGAKSKTKGFLIKFALNKADLITCDAEHMRDEMTKLGVPDSKIRIICFGIDTQKFCPGPKDEKLCKELGVSGYKVVVSLRSLEPIYDIETLIRAVPLVLKEVQDTKFMILGKGSQERELRDLTRSSGILENVRFVGAVPNDRLPRYMRLADIYVSTSLSDAGIAASTAEAMACALPVVVTNTGENEKWITDGENGYLVPTKDPEKLAEKIIYLLRDENLSGKFARTNRRIIEERDNYYKEMAKIANIYQELAKRRTGCSN